MRTFNKDAVVLLSWNEKGNEFISSIFTGDSVRFYTSEINYINIKVENGKLIIRGIEALKITPHASNSIIIEQERI